MTGAGDAARVEDAAAGATTVHTVGAEAGVGSGYGCVRLGDHQDKTQASRTSQWQNPNN